MSDPFLACSVDRIDSDDVLAFELPENMYPVLDECSISKENKISILLTNIINTFIIELGESRIDRDNFIQIENICSMIKSLTSSINADALIEYLIKNIVYDVKAYMYFMDSTIRGHKDRNGFSHDYYVELERNRRAIIRHAEEQERVKRWEIEEQERQRSEEIKEKVRMEIYRFEHIEKAERQRAKKERNRAKRQEIKGKKH